MSRLKGQHSGPTGVIQVCLANEEIRARRSGPFHHVCKVTVLFVAAYFCVGKLENETNAARERERERERERDRERDRETEREKFSLFCEIC